MLVCDVLANYLKALFISTTLHKKLLGLLTIYINKQKKERVLYRIEFHQQKELNLLLFFFNK